MKNIKILLAVMFLCLGMATMGWCLEILDGPYGGTDVGGIDSFVASINYKTAGYVNSNPTTESAWVNSVLSESATYYSKDESATIYDTTQDGTNAVDGVYAVYMESPPDSEYFLVKNDDYWALFANLGAIDWGVFDRDSLPEGMNEFDNYTVSHVSRFDGTPVPEPATMLLSGLGLLGMGIFLRRRFRK